MKDQFLEKTMEQVQGRIPWHFGMDSWCLGKFPGKRRRAEEKISIQLEFLNIQQNPVLPCNSRTFRRYSRWSYIARQCTVAGWFRRVHLPHRERSRHALHHQKWTDPRRKKQQNGWTVSVLHSCEPDVRWKRSGRSSIRSGQTQNRSVQKYLEISPKTVYWCNLKLAQTKGMQFYQTRSHAITLSSTLPPICIENVVCMKTGEE